MAYESDVTLSICATSARSRAFALTLLVAGCAHTATRSAANPGTADLAHTHALLLNGGGRPDVNYQSHLQHVKSVVTLLEADGVPAAQITIFSGDGDDPAADLATRERRTDPDFWLIPQNSSLRPPVVFVNSTVDGKQLRPARKEALQAWFATNGQKLRPGDTLLFYVTDHGHLNPQDLGNNTIVLWGEEMNVSDLRDLLKTLDPQVRVVMLMSQCFSGSFANAIYLDGPAILPDRSICGYFASTADRPAYGCYPENRGKDGVGHTFHFLQALAPLGSFSEANRRAQVTDNSPDVPHTSSDTFAEHVLQQQAAAAGTDFTAYVDALLAEAWHDPHRWEPDIRLLDRIGNAYGCASARSLAELDDELRTLPEFSKQLATYAERWRLALEALKAENLKAFADTHPGWTERLKPDQLKTLDAAAREHHRNRAPRRVGAVHPRRRGPLCAFGIVEAPRRRRRRPAHYRTDVRLGAVLRMRAVLINVAGRQYMATHATPEQRQSAERLTACEDVQLVAQPAVASAALLDAPAPYPPLADEQQVVTAVMPAWMGINYEPLKEPDQQHYGVQRGAAMVRSVYPDSPAAKAKLQVGDIILGPRGTRFAEPNQIREWTMRSEIDRAERLDVQRDGRVVNVTLRPAPYPIEMPKLPGPPKVGSVAPALKVDVLRGAKKLADGKPRLLFFWATWCAICKGALPEVMAFSQERNVEVLAISDEAPETVQPFLDGFKEPFPTLVATDRRRITFQSYGVSGLPTFVYVDGQGIVRHVQSGYTPKIGLQIDGWKWEPAGKQAATDSAAPSSGGQP